MSRRIITEETRFKIPQDGKYLLEVNPDLKLWAELRELNWRDLLFVIYYADHASPLAYLHLDKQLDDKAVRKIIAKYIGATRSYSGARSKDTNQAIIVYDKIQGPSNLLSFRKAEAGIRAMYDNVPVQGLEEPDDAFIKRQVQYAGLIHKLGKDDTLANLQESIKAIESEIIKRNKEGMNYHKSKSFDKKSLAEGASNPKEEVSDEDWNPDDY